MKLFESISSRRPKLNKFDLSHERKMSLNMGDLVPILINEVVPGDKFRVSNEVFIRMAPMLAPVMHRVNLSVHYFFVPNRLVWDEWEDFITGGRLGTSNPEVPNMLIKQVDQNHLLKGTLADYMGVPALDASAAITQPVWLSALPFRAYQLIWDDYYRDQNLQASLDIDKRSGNIGDSSAELVKLLTMRKRAWEKDRLTSALPWAQRGGEVSMPGSPIYSPHTTVWTEDGIGVTPGPGSLGVPAANDAEGHRPMINEADSSNVQIQNLDGVGVTINDLRKSARLQEWLEKNARGGARYIEQILSHFGVVSSDARLQRPEYLGGTRQPVVISEVLSTYENADATGNPQGNMSGHGISAGSGNGFSRRFEEHGFVIGLMSVLPKTAYQQGLDKMFSRADRFEYFWPEFANLGEEEVKLKEVYLDYEAAVANAENVFGYQSRYSDYKYKASSVHGDFRDNLSYWHMGRIFDAPPVLNESFITSDPTSRIFNVEDPSEHHLYCQLYHHISALRPMPYYGTPQL